MQTLVIIYHIFHHQLTLTLNSAIRSMILALSWDSLIMKVTACKFMNLRCRLLQMCRGLGLLNCNQCFDIEYLQTGRNNGNM